MEKNILKRRKVWMFFIILVVVIGVGIYVLLPRMDGMLFRKEVGTLDSWKEMCGQENARFLSYDIPDSGEQTKDEYHQPKATDSVFSFDGVVKVDDGLYITGIRGLTDWGMMIRMYSRKNMTLETPQEISGEHKTWNFYLTCKGAEQSDFPHRENSEMLVGNKSFAYPVTTYLVAPDSIDEDGTLTLLYHTGKDYKEQKEIKIDVKQLKLDE